MEISVRVGLEEGLVESLHNSILFYCLICNFTLGMIWHGGWSWNTFCIPSAFSEGIQQQKHHSLEHGIPKLGLLHIQENGKIQQILQSFKLTWILCKTLWNTLCENNSREGQRLVDHIILIDSRERNREYKWCFLNKYGIRKKASNGLRGNLERFKSLCVQSVRPSINTNFYFFLSLKIHALELAGH